MLLILERMIDKRPEADRILFAELYGEEAGVLEGASEGELDEPLARQAAALCRAAGADLDAIPAWIEEGRRRMGRREHAAALGWLARQRKAYQAG